MVNFSPIPYLIIMPAFVVFASARVFRQADASPSDSTSRFSALDGLRGFLALGVFFDHSSIYYNYMTSRAWTPSVFYRMLGAGGVSFFFMITGYLFWKKILIKRGVISWIDLYIKRIFRIGPVYIVSILAVMIIVLVRTKFEIREGFFGGLSNVLRWGSLGIFPAWDLNGYNNTNLILAFVTWTLFYEWRFYFSLPFLSVASKNKALSIIAPTSSLVSAYAYFWFHPNCRSAILIALFCIGMIAAALDANKLAIKSNDKVKSLVASALLVIVYSSCAGIYTISSSACLGIIFYLIVSECSIFGILKFKGARRLGNVSYDTYLLQGPLLNVLFSIAFIRDFSLESTQNYWISIAVIGFILIIVSTMIHVTVERPGIQIGKIVAREAVKLYPTFRDTRRPV